MIVLPEADWSPESGGSGSFLTGAAAPLPLGTFRLPSDPHLLASAPPDDDPVTRADSMRLRAGEVFQRHRAIGAFNRELDDLFTNIAEGTDWSEGLSKYDKEIGNLRQKHLAELRTPDDRAAFELHAEAFAAMQRIGLKRALVERQQGDALAQLDDQLAYYAGKAATTPNEVFRQIAIDAGERAIAELRDAGYLFPESADKRQQAFLGLIDGADLESIVNANPDEALGVLDNPALFPRADTATRQRLKAGLHLLPATGEPSPIRTMDYHEDRDGPYRDPTPLGAPASEGAAAEGGESADLGNVDDIAKALAPPAEKADSLDGVGVGDGEILNPDDEAPPIELSDEQIDLLAEAILSGASLATMRGGGRAAGKAIVALRDTLRQTLRSFFKAPKSDDGGAAAPPKLPTGGIKHVDPAENLATGRYAADKVLSDHGDVAGAMYRPDFGSITFNYGKPGNPAKAFEGGSGLSHIEAKHGAEIAREVVPRTLAYGRLDRMYGPPNGRRADIVHGDGRVTLSLFRDKQRETWVITGFEAHK